MAALSGRGERAGLPRRWRKDADEEGRRDATSIIACCDLRDEEDRVTSRRRETSSSRNRVSKNRRRGEHGTLGDIAKGGTGRTHGDGGKKKRCGKP